LKKTVISDYFCKLDIYNKVKTSGLATSEEQTGQESVSVYGEQPSTVLLKMQWTVTSQQMQEILLYITGRTEVQ